MGLGTVSSSDTWNTFDVESHLAIPVDAELQVVFEVVIGWRLLEGAVDFLQILCAAFKVSYRSHLVVDSYISVADDVDPILTTCKVLSNWMIVSVGEFNAGIIDPLWKRDRKD